MKKDWCFSATQIVFIQNICIIFHFFIVNSRPTVSPANVASAGAPQNGSSVILSIFRDMVAVGEQQEALLLRELETDISVQRCVEIMNYLEENMALVGLENDGTGFLMTSD